LGFFLASSQITLTAAEATPCFEKRRRKKEEKYFGWMNENKQKQKQT